MTGTTIPYHNNAMYVAISVGCKDIVPGETIYCATEKYVEKLRSMLAACEVQRKATMATTRLAILPVYRATDRILG